MPLSEEELRLLEQMERALAEEDPKFVSTLQGRTIEHAAKMRAIAAGVVFVLGMGMLFGGAVSQQVWLGVLGFVVMLASAVLGLTAWRGRTAQPQPEVENHQDHPTSDAFQDKFRLVEGGKRDRHPKRPKAPKSSGTFMQRMEQRWQNRKRGF